MSDKSTADVVFIKELADLLNASDLCEMEVERVFAEGGELKVRLARGTAPVAVAAPTPNVQTLPASPPQEADAPATSDTAAGPDLSNAVTSPMVGTVYLAPEPGAAPFVSAGDEVQEGQTLLIIEAMKTMNQIPAPRAGKVRVVLVENAEPVEFGEPLMIIE